MLLGLLMCWGDAEDLKQIANACAQMWTTDVDDGL